MIKVGLLSAFVLLATGCHSSMDYTIQERRARVGEFITRETKSDAPGIQYLVCSPESTIFSFAGGWGDISSARPLQDGTTMMIYSMSKTFTAAAVLQLGEGAAEDVADLGGDVDRLGRFRERLHRLAGIEVRIDIGKPARIAHRQHQHGHGLAVALRDATHRVFRAGTVLHAECADAAA